MSMASGFEVLTLTPWFALSCKLLQGKPEFITQWSNPWATLNIPPNRNLFTKGCRQIPKKNCGQRAVLVKSSTCWEPVVVSANKILATTWLETEMFNQETLWIISFLKIEFSHTYKFLYEYNHHWCWLYKNNSPAVWCTGFMLSEYPAGHLPLKGVTVAWRLACKPTQ